MEENYNGVVQDPRSEEQKALDYKYEELTFGDIPLNWIEYSEKNLKSYPIQNQDGSLSCVAQATVKLLAMHEVKEGKGYTQLCPKFIYTRRENYPSGGMWLPNALSLACNFGACEEILQPCDMKGESFMSEINEQVSLFENAKNFKGKYYFEITGGIDKIAEVMEQGYGVLLGFRFDYNEWTDVPEVKQGFTNKVGHGVAGVDYCLWEGGKALLIEDSWGVGTGKGGRRIITEDFLNKKCFYAGYVTSLPNYVFTKTLKIGSKGIDVKKLQEKLNTLGSNLKVDGDFGKLTKSAVISFQSSKGLVPDGIVGKNTNRILNE